MGLEFSAFTVSVAIGVCLGFALRVLGEEEVLGRTRRLSIFLVRLAARRLPYDRSDRREEWIAELYELDDVPLTQLCFALNVLRLAGRTAREMAGDSLSVAVVRGALLVVAFVVLNFIVGVIRLIRFTAWLILLALHDIFRSARSCVLSVGRLVATGTAFGIALELLLVAGRYVGMSLGLELYDAFVVGFSVALLVWLLAEALMSARRTLYRIFTNARHGAFALGDASARSASGIRAQLGLPVVPKRHNGSFQQPLI